MVLLDFLSHKDYQKFQENPPLDVHLRCAFWLSQSECCSALRREKGRDLRDRGNYIRDGERRHRATYTRAQRVGVRHATERVSSPAPLTTPRPLEGFHAQRDASSAMAPTRRGVVLVRLQGVLEYFTWLRKTRES